MRLGAHDHFIYSYCNGELHVGGLLLSARDKTRVRRAQAGELSSFVGSCSGECGLPDGGREAGEPQPPRIPGLARQLPATALTGMYLGAILSHMKTTLNIDDSLLRKAAKLTGVAEKTSLVRMGLEALIARESARRLAALGGTEKTLTPVPRRRGRRAA